jgi:hypothetical protein
MAREVTVLRTYSDMIIRCALALAELVLGDVLCAADAPPGTYWVPTTSVVAELEHGLSLPQGAYPLAKYTRYYTGLIRNGRHVVRGIFVGGAPKVVIVKSELALPVVMDGGCHIINVDYEVESHKVLQVFCNGYA